MRPLLLPALLAAMALVAVAQTPPGKHTVTVTVTYDFTKTPPCSAKIKKNCVSRIVVYDISAGVNQRRNLATIPVDPNTPAKVQDLTVTTPPMTFEPGKHLLAAVAQTPDNVESNPKLCKTWIEIPPPQQ
jgi:hypothetical protein